MRSTDEILCTIERRLCKLHADIEELREAGDDSDALLDMALDRLSKITKSGEFNEQ
jgi:hypothetical protein